MAYYGDQVVANLYVGSLVGQYLPVFLNIASSRDSIAVPAATNSQDVIGLTIATGASVGNTLGVAVAGWAKARAAASLGAGARVGIASTNGALGPIQASGVGALPTVVAQAAVATAVATISDALATIVFSIPSGGGTGATHLIHGHVASAVTIHGHAVQGAGGGETAKIARYQVGKALEAAAAGDVFAVLLDPAEIV